MPSERSSKNGLLIVNADDWGLDAIATDTAVRCFENGAITSATGMVWMRDSERAAATARRLDLPMGLHLNLIEPFDAPEVPESVAERQRRVAQRFAALGARAFLYDPRWSAVIERCITDQLQAFRDLYGRAPTHVDGHRHGHLALNVVLARSLAGVRRLRPAFTYMRAERAEWKRLSRALLNVLIRTRFRTPDRLFNIRSLHPRLGGERMAEKLGLAADHAVEVMVHPWEQDELEVLSGEDWRAAIGRHRLGTYAQL